MKRAARTILEWIWLPLALFPMFVPTVGLDLMDYYQNGLYMEAYLHGLQRHPGIEWQIGCVTLEVHAEYVLAACGNPVGRIGAGN